MRLLTFVICVEVEFGAELAVVCRKEEPCSERSQCVAHRLFFSSFGVAGFFSFVGIHHYHHHFFFFVGAASTTSIFRPFPFERTNLIGASLTGFIIMLVNPFC